MIPEHPELGLLVAFVRSETIEEKLYCGPILFAHAAFYDYLQATGGGWDIEDHLIAAPPCAGLLVYEGWVEVDAGEDPEVRFEGSWRTLSHLEILLVARAEWDDFHHLAGRRVR